MFNMLSEVGILGCKVVNTPMNLNLKLLLDWVALGGQGRYRKTGWKFNHLIIT